MIIEIPFWLQERMYRAYEIFYHEYCTMEYSKLLKLFEDNKDIIDEYSFGKFSIILTGIFEDTDYYNDTHLMLEIDIRYNDKLLDSFNISSNMTTMISVNSFKTLYKLKERYTFCTECNRKGFIGMELCKICYLNYCKGPEPCCICFNENGVWHKMKCGHVLHKYCYIQIKNQKCPLCRANLEYEEIYPYYEE